MERLLEATARAERRHFWFTGFRAFAWPVIDRVLRGQESPRILDAGCGTGHNLLQLATRGRAVGIDLARLGLEYARRTPQPPPVTQGTIARLPFGDAQFDLVTCFDILQCLAEEDEPQAAREICRVLRAGGYAIINVSALEALRGGHSVLTHEIRRYTRAQVRRLVEGAGLEVLRLTYTFLSLLPLIAGVRFAQRLAGLPESDEDAAAAREIAVPPRFVNAALSGVVRAEAQMLRIVNMPLGTSLLCVARKPLRP